jgi:hypothetical protein
MSNIDGHCATDAETVYVGTIGTATCSDTATSAGSAQVPYCTAQSGVGIAKAKGRPLVVMTGALAPSSPVVGASLTIVGKSGATITPALASDGITITSGEIYLRNLTVQGNASTSTGIGVSAGTGVTLHMDTCTVKNNPGGGILLNGSAFDIKNTAVMGNGQGRTGAVVWGGILVNNLPTTGPTNLGYVTIQTNVGGGITCAGGIQGTGVLSSGNTNASLGQIDSVCAISTGVCTTASATCGTQATPQ